MAIHVDHPWPLASLQNRQPEKVFGSGQVSFW